MKKTQSDFKVKTIISFLIYIHGFSFFFSFPFIYLRFLNQVIIVSSSIFVASLSSLILDFDGDGFNSNSFRKRLNCCFVIQLRILLAHFDLMMRP